MAIQIQGYRERRELGQGIGTPGVRPGVAETGVGQAIERAAASVEGSYEKVVRENAETESLAAAAKTRMELEEAYRDAQTQAEAGAPNFTPTFLNTFDKAVTSGAEGLSNDVARKRYHERMNAYKIQAQERALNWEVGERITKRSRDFATSADANANSVYTVDGVSRDLTYQALTEDMNSSLDAIGLPPSVREQLREEAKTKLSYAAIQGDLRDRPEKVQDWLIKGNGSSYYLQLRSTESGGRNIGSRTSSAFGPYQFLEGTWDGLISRHPELGLTKADRFRPEAQEVAIRAFTADNANALKKAGIAQTNTNLYMQHLLGEQGGVDFIRAFEKNPNAEAKQFVSAAAVAANPGIFKPGRPVGEVMALFGRKFGAQISWDKTSNSPSYYSDIPFKQRDTLYSAAETEMNKRRVKTEAAFKQREQNSIAEYAANGSSTDALTESDFINALGPQRGSIDYGEYAANATAAAAAYKLQRMPLNEHNSYIESLKPKPGDPFYAEKQVGYEKVKAIGAEVRRAITEDFGQYVVSRNEVARSLLATAFDGQKTQNEGAAAADQYAQIIEAEAHRMGIAGSNRVLLPKAYSNSIGATLNQELTSDADAKAKVAALNAYADRWGKHWPSIYRDLKDNMSAPVQVITSRIKDKAAVILASVHDKSFQELARIALPRGDAITIEDDMHDAFEPLRTSTMWQSTALPGVGVFEEQAKKLAAVYVAQGVSIGDAAEQAFEDIIGFKYRFVDSGPVNIRIPKEADTRFMEYYLKQERAAVLNSSRIQASPDELKIDPDASNKLRHRLLRNSLWVTLPDNSGVGLMYQGKLRADSKGHPIFMTWDEVKANSQKWEEHFKLHPFESIRPDYEEIGKM